MTGPTTTGSIDAKLTIDKSAWDRSVAEAKAEAKELGDLSPTVRVDANVGPALVKLDEVAAIERKLEEQNIRLAATEKGLNQEQINSTSGALRLATVEKMLGEGRRSESTETDKATTVERAHTVERDKGTESTNRATQANQRNVSGIGVLIAMAPAVLAAAAPIAAGAVGLGAAFGVMGVAGVLAIKGIKDEMASGTVVGNTYATGLGVLKGDLDQLAATSADKMLGAFSSAVGDINSRMPFLTQMTGDFAGMLGQIGGTALQGVLDGMRQMNPLIQAGGIELSKFVTWLTSFNGTNGFNEFINYAIENLPSVMHLIESLVTTAGHILAAFAPLGPVVVGFLTALSDGLSSLPLPALAGLVTTATTIAPALRLAGTAMAWFGVESSMAIPVVGVFVAALAGIGVAAATAASSTDSNTVSMVSYGDAVERDNGLIGENVRLQAAHAATTREMRDAADTLGVSTTTVMQAMLGNKDALAQVNTATQYNTDKINANQRSGEDLIDTAARMDAARHTLTGGIDNNSSAIHDNIDAYNAYKSVTEQTTPALSAQAAAAAQLAGQYGTTVAALQGAETAQANQATAAQNATTQMQLENDAAGLLKGSLDKLNGKTLTAAQAQNAFDSSLANMGDHVNATGKKIHFTTTSITDMSAASVALRGQLNGQIANLQGVVEANGGLANSTGKARQQMVDMRTQIINNAVAHGVDRDAVTKYIDKLLAIPKKVPPTKLDIDKAAADAKLAAFKAMVIAATQRRTQYIDIITNRIDGPGKNTSAKDPAGTGSSVGGRANGSLAGGAATGGLIHAGFSASSPAYLSEGGSPFVPRGTDTVPAMLTPGEIVMKRASVNSIGAGTLLEANRTGKLPTQAGSGAGTTEQIVLNLTVPDKATAKDYFDEVRFQLRQRNRGGALA
jgi:hypothetical protein